MDVHVLHFTLLRPRFLPLEVQSCTRIRLEAERADLVGESITLGLQLAGLRSLFDDAIFEACVLHLVFDFLDAALPLLDIALDSFVVRSETLSIVDLRLSLGDRRL